MSRKKIAILCTALVLSAMVAVGGTLAYFTSTTNQISNSFTAGNIKGELREATWDNITWNHASAGITSPLGIDLAKHYVPGMTIPKNPQVKNESNLIGSSESTFVAIKLDCTYGSGFFQLRGAQAWNAIQQKFRVNLDVVGVAPNALGDWTQDKKDPTLYYYTPQRNNKATLAAGAVTPALFTSIAIPTTYTEDDCLQGFQINAQAYLVQGENIGDGTVQSAIATGFPSLFH